jgi:hypothetical protein
MVSATWGLEGTGTDSVPVLTVTATGMVPPTLSLYFLSM